MSSAAGFSYVVRVSLERADALDAFMTYLVTRHVADVLAAGAEDAELVRLEGAVEARYRFASREAFERYEREEAPALRAHALAELDKHGVAPGRGASFTRWTGEIVPFARALR